jgi:predicted nucleic acid-binding protein
VIVADASVLIAHLDADDHHHARAEALLASIVAQPLLASRLTLAEVLVGPARARKLEVAMAGLAQLGIEGVGLDARSPGRLAGLRALTGLKMPDCCVLLAAEQLHGELATLDERLGAQARSLGLAVRSR